MTIYLLATIAVLTWASPDREWSRFEAIRRARSASELERRKREYDDIEVLRLACEREIRLKRVPVACFRLHGPRPDLVRRCSESVTRAEFLPPKADWIDLPKGCREKVVLRHDIIEYKKNGRDFE